MIRTVERRMPNAHKKSVRPCFKQRQRRTKATLLGRASSNANDVSQPTAPLYKQRQGASLFFASPFLASASRDGWFFFASKDLSLMQPCATQLFSQLIRKTTLAHF